MKPEVKIRETNTPVPTIPSSEMRRRSDDDAHSPLFQPQSKYDEEDVKEPYRPNEEDVKEPYRLDEDDVKTPHRRKVVLIGDSTIDNKIWIDSTFGAKGNYLKQKFGITRDDSATRIKKSHRWIGGPELTVAEHLTDNLGETYQVCDYTNDGFTSNDILVGARKNKAFGNLFPSLYPDQHFAPLKEAAQDIREAQTIVLSVGGNDFREFMHPLLHNHFGNPIQRAHYIRTHFFETIKTMQSNYLAIVEKLHSLNKEAHLVLMTQYYPSFNQNHYKIYELMQEIGRALSSDPDPLHPKFECTNPNNPKDVIHAIMSQTYNEVFKKIEAMPNLKVTVADITSTLDPISEKNHASQIEPNGQGGKKIAQVLSSTIKSPRFGEAILFSARLNDYEFAPQMSKWQPKHPNEFIGKATYNPSSAALTLQKNKVLNNVLNTAVEDFSNTNFRLAIIVANQIAPHLLRPAQYQAIKTNKELQMALVAAHGYYNSGRFGFFRTHGLRGIIETQSFVRNILSLNKDVYTEMQSWLKTSNTNNSSRAFYAANSGFFRNIFPTGKTNYATATKQQRSTQLREMLTTPRPV